MIDYFSLQILAECGYEKNNKLPIDWEQIGETVINQQTGFCGKVFKNDENEIVISFSGTDFNTKGTIFDISNDINMAIKNIPPQVENARILYDIVKQTYPNLKITLTGHSLGGSIAQILAKETGAKTVTFNPFATGKGQGSGDEYSNITNIIDSQDFISMSDINNHPGNIYVIPNDSGNIVMPQFNLNPPYHNIKNMLIIGMEKYKRNSVKSFLEKMEDGDNHKNLKTARDVVKKVYDKWDEYRTHKETLSKNPQGNVYTSNDESYNGGTNTLKGYVSNSDGRWVTINGNHVYLGD